VAELFMSQPNTWISGMAIAAIGGCFAWRTRISDARREYHLNIRNRCRRVKRRDGSIYIESEYMNVTSTEAVSGEGAGSGVISAAPAV